MQDADRDVHGSNQEPPALTDVSFRCHCYYSTRKEYVDVVYSKIPLIRFRFLRFSNVDAAAKKIKSSSSSPNKSFSKSLSAKTTNSTRSSPVIFNRVVVQASPAHTSNNTVGLNPIQYRWKGIAQFNLSKNFHGKFHSNG